MTEDKLKITLKFLKLNIIVISLNDLFYDIYFFTDKL